MVRVLVIGGTGFVGRWMREQQPPVDAVFIGKYDYDHWRWDMQKWDYIVHLAHIPPTKALKVAASCGAKFLYCSSGAIFDHAPDEYGLEKRRWEDESLEYKNTVVARLFTFYGKWLDDGKAIVQFAKQAVLGKPLRIWGDGSTVRSYMHGSEMAEWMWAILFEGYPGRVYEVGSEKPVTMLELARNIARKKNIPIHILGLKEKRPYYLPQNTAPTRQLVERYKKRGTIRSNGND